MLEALIIWLIIGAIAGWAAGQLVKGYGFGLLGNIVVGIVGAIIAGWLLPFIGFVIAGGIIAAIINAIIGAVILDYMLCALDFDGRPARVRYDRAAAGADGVPRLQPAYEASLSAPHRHMMPIK